MEISKAGSGEGPGKATTRAYSTKVATRLEGRPKPCTDPIAIPLALFVVPCCAAVFGIRLGAEIIALAIAVPTVLLTDVA